MHYDALRYGNRQRKICDAINKEKSPGYFPRTVVCVVATKNEGVESHMKKGILPTVLLCTAVCIGLHTPTNQADDATPTPEPPQIEITATPTPVPEPEIEEPIVEVIIPQPEPTPEPAVQPPATSQTVQAGDMVYVPGFGWLESQGEGTVTYDETIRENGNKVGVIG